MDQTKLNSESKNRLLIYLNVLIVVLIFTIFYVGNNIGELIECNARLEFHTNFIELFRNEINDEAFSDLWLASSEMYECRYGDVTMPE
jgi:hypothetical protein